MSVFVVDSSVAAKWFSNEAHADAALAVLDESNDLHAPDFFLIEFDNVVCKWVRRGLLSAREGVDVREAVRQCPVELHPFAALMDSAFAIANETQRSLYDCLYVALAALLDGSMVTADRRLCDAIASGPFAAHITWVEDAS